MRVGQLLHSARLVDSRILTTLIERQLKALFPPRFRQQILLKLLGNSYMLALDRSIWDGKVAPALEQRLSSSLGVVVASTTNRDDDIWELLELQGLQELRHWGATQEPELGEWAKLMAPPPPDAAAGWRP